ncbi:hypothetical protein OKW76_07025 [Sphingomonas sp. S1-29]|uniref:hypothetical protein n=1 Tax=Sphingomonas sp. S1-29 TaxID=2991074 RepID=UPI00224033BA|nr:hypothetical protein [Sphingomonas sp. S1-29]UZK70767.1 hypothetical protein OKW76_07025 [Sphingomonas sp. S1-29]
MKIVWAAMMSASLAGCGSPPTENTATTTGANEIAVTPVIAEPAVERVVELPDTFVTQNPLGACKALIAVVNGRDPGTMTAKKLEDNLFHVSYRRPDDGKRWQSRCQITPDGQSMQWAQFDAFDDGQQGRWRTEDVATYTVEGSSLTVSVDMMGDAITKTYPMSKVMG